MMLRRYGTSVQSVDLNFNSKALTEIGFRKNKKYSEPADAFMVGWERLSGCDLGGRAEGSVQNEAEQRLLENMESDLRRTHDGQRLVRSC